MPADTATAGPLRTGVPADLARHRVLRALRTRKRYRYVRPEVRATHDGFVIVSPCCSRNVDPAGGAIDIAWLERAGGRWRLHHRDHENQCWMRSAEGTLPALLDLLCADPDRRFWP